MYFVEGSYGKGSIVCTEQKCEPVICPQGFLPKPLNGTDSGPCCKVLVSFAWICCLIYIWDRWYKIMHKYKQKYRVVSLNHFAQPLPLTKERSLNSVSLGGLGKTWESPTGSVAAVI